MGTLSESDMYKEGKRTIERGLLVDVVCLLKREIRRGETMTR